MYNSADGEEELTFPNAKHVVQKLEWEDAMQPNKRSANTYWEENFSKLKTLKTCSLLKEILPFVRESKYSIPEATPKGTRLSKSNRKKKLPIILQTCCQPMYISSPLWIMAYDNFPMDVIGLKEKYETMGIQGKCLVYLLSRPFHVCLQV